MYFKMNNPSRLKLERSRKWLLFQAAADFFFLLNRSYPRARALELTGNRHNLDAFERMLLSRGLFGQEEALSRLRKREMGSNWLKGALYVDAHNVQITIESHLESRPLLKANDGALRDLAGQSSGFRLTETSNMAMEMLFRFFEEFPPREAVFLFDQPMSHSGDLASLYRARQKELRIPGDARAVPVPEREIPYDRCVAASSDRAVLNASSRWIDLACLVAEYFAVPEITADFSSMVLSRSPAKQLANLW